MRTWGVKMKEPFFFYGGPHTEIVSHLVHALLLTGYSRRSHLLGLILTPASESPLSWHQQEEPSDGSVMVENRL